MGITGLLPFLNDSSRRCNLNEFRGQTAVIDSYCWLHKGAFACADKLVRGEQTEIYATYCLKFIKLLESYNIKPIMVFDGQHLSAKKNTEHNRRAVRASAKARGTELLLLGKNEEALRYFRQCIDISHKMALSLIKECRKRNVDCIVAPYEADAQLAYLNIQGIADLVITEDSDLVMFGCTKILFKLDLTGFGTLVEKDKIIISMKMRPDQYSFSKFRHMCILSGCDYVNSLSGIGLQRARKAVTLAREARIANFLKRLPNYLNMKHLLVSKDYIEQFQLADAAIQCQIVYDPLIRKLVHLTSPENAGISDNYLKNAGTMYDDGKAFQMALGNIDPIHDTVLDDWNPDNQKLLGCHFQIVFNEELMVPYLNVSRFVFLPGNLEIEQLPKTQSASDEHQAGSSIWSRNYIKSNRPTKIASNPIIPAKSTIGKQVMVDITLEQITASELEKIDYDNKLSNELKAYYYTPSPLSQIDRAEAESPKEENPEHFYKQVELNNPFLKRKPLSKFEATSVLDKVVTSHFFKKDAGSENISTLDHDKYETKARIVSNTSSNEDVIGDSKIVYGDGLGYLFENDKPFSSKTILHRKEMQTNTTIRSLIEKKDSLLERLDYPTNPGIDRCYNKDDGFCIGCANRMYDSETKPNHDSDKNENLKELQRENSLSPKIPQTAILNIRSKFGNPRKRKLAAHQPTITAMFEKMKRS